MKKLHEILTILALCLSAATAYGQESPVRWKGAVEDNGGGRYTLTMTADIAEGWHMYDLGPYEGGPNATTITSSIACVSSSRVITSLVLPAIATDLVW